MTFHKAEEDLMCELSTLLIREIKGEEQYHVQKLLSNHFQVLTGL